MTLVLTDFANIKFVRKRYELANSVQFYLIREDIKRWNIFSNIFDTTLRREVQLCLYSEKLK